MSNSKFISKINERLTEMVGKFTGARVFGLAQSIIRLRADGSSELMPALVDIEGEGVYIGIDDIAPITIYHKANSIGVSEKQNSGYGDARANKINAYSNSMIVFMDRSITKMLPDEMLFFFQANLPDELKGFQGYKSVNVRVQNIILNSQQVFASEYQNVDYRIPPRFSLLAINYQIESVFDKNCFVTCP